MNSMIRTEGGITIFTNGKPYSVENTHLNYEQVIQAIKEDRWDDIPELVNIAHALKRAVANCTDVDIDVDAGVVTLHGEIVHGTIATRLINMVKEGFDVQPLSRFLVNLYDNPSRTAVTELYDYLEYGNNPITPDGCFLAYKRVRSDYKSVHDGKTDNKVGNVVELPRNKVDDDRNKTCSYGLHFCSHEYLRHFGGDRIVVLKVNPRDVVSIPSDYNNTKGRACRYEIVGELTSDEKKTIEQTNKSIWTAPVVSTYEPVNKQSLEYQDGYDEGHADYFWDGVNWHLVDDSERDSYNAGYAAGVEDAISDDGWDSVEEYKNWVTEDIVANTKPKDTPVPRTGSVPVAFNDREFEDGYNDGYRDGRTKNQKVTKRPGSYTRGYDLGYQHGRGHKRKLTF